MIYPENDAKGVKDMNIRYLKLLAPVIPFFLLFQGGLFYGNLGAAQQSGQIHAEVNRAEPSDSSVLFTELAKRSSVRSVSARRR